MIRLRESSGPILTVLSILIAVAPASAQERTLTLDQAISQARRNNPQYRQTANDETDAAWGVRQAYTAFLPSLSVGTGFSYQEGGTPRVGNLSAAEFGLGSTPGTYTSDYGVRMNVGLSGRDFAEIGRAKANHRAVEARIESAAYDLETAVTAQYLAVLRARDNVTISRSALETAKSAYNLAEARHAAGAATRLDMTQAQVDRGRAEVALIQAENTYDIELLRLAQQMGVELDPTTRLTSTFVVFEPQWTLEELTAMALESHPRLVAAREAESAARTSSRQSFLDYLPSLSFSGSWSGYVRKVGSDQYLIDRAHQSAANAREDCEFLNHISAGLSTPLPDRPADCSEIRITSADEQQIIASNSLFPFNYTSSPAYFSMSISFPVLTGFSRERSLAAAKAQAMDMEYQRRGEELARRTEVAANLRTLQTAHRTVQIEESNAAAASEQLEIATERYRLGAGCGAGGTAGLCTTYLELTQAQERKARADQAHLAALYAFHEALAMLEAAVGRTLR